MAGQPTFQGSRDLRTDWQGAISQQDAYYPVLGNGAFFYADSTISSGDMAEMYAMSKHTVDFAGELEFFSVKLDGNSMSVNTILSIRINDVDTAQVVVAEPLISGKYECSEPAVAFALGDEIVGHAASPTFTRVSTSGFWDSSPDISQVYIQMTPDSGVHTCYRVCDSLYVSAWDEGVAQIPLSGNLYHYNPERSLRYPEDSDSCRPATQMRVRTAGAFSYLQATIEAESLDIALFGLRKNDDTENGPTLVCSGTDNWGYYVNTSETLEVVPGDLVNMVAAEGTVAGSFYLWSMGCNFSGSSPSGGVDVLVYANPYASGDYDEPRETRGGGIDWWDYLPVRYGGIGEFFSGRTTWKTSVFGADYPQLLAWDMPESDTPAFSDEYLALMIRNRQIEPTFEFTVRSLRVYMDLNVSGAPLLVFISKGSEGYIAKGGLFVEIEDEGWYENSSDSEDFPVDDVTENAAFGTGMSITVIPANFTPLYDEFGQRDQFEYTTSAIAHIASIGFTYRAESNDRECLVRELPEADPVEALPNFTRLVRSIKVTRPDGIVNAYTEHDEDIVHEGVTYKAIGGGMKATASELGAQLGDVGNMEFQGYSAPGGIQADDLFGGAYDSAEIEVWLLPWGPDNDQAARRIGGGVLGRNRQADDSFSIEALSWSSHLSQRSLLEIVTPTCRYELGETRCGVVLPCLTVTGSVTVATDDTSALGQRRKFQDILRTEDTGRFSEGIVTFSTGPNAGHSRKIKTHEALGIFTLWDPFVYPIGVGDDYSMSPGCDKKSTTCRTKFENFVNFGGFPTVPGSDAANQTPSGKMGQ